MYRLPKDGRARLSASTDRQGLEIFGIEYNIKMKSDIILDMNVKRGMLALSGQQIDALVDFIVISTP